MKYKKALPQITQIIDKELDNPDHPDPSALFEDKQAIEELMNMDVNTYAGSIECYDKMRFLVNKYNQKYKVEIPQDNERNMLIKLYENRRTLTI